MGTAVDVSGLLQRQRDTSADESVEHKHGHRHGKSGVRMESRERGSIRNSRQGMIAD